MIYVIVARELQTYNGVGQGSRVSKDPYGLGSRRRVTGVLY